jgi:protocatechuate 3,4-dioxygenase beta subunit
MTFVLRTLAAALVAGTLASPSPCGAAPRKAEPVESPSRVRVAPPSERGEPLTLHVRVEDAATGKPVSGAKLFVYQTDAAGYYDRGEDGRERGPRGARLHATAFSDPAGTIVYDTVVPGSYPGSGIFKHIHFVLSAGGYAELAKEIILDEAPRPTAEQKRWAERNGDIVARRAKGAGGGSEIRVTLKLRPATEG